MNGIFKISNAIPKDEFYKKLTRVRTQFDEFVLSGEANAHVFYSILRGEFGINCWSDSYSRDENYTIILNGFTLIIEEYYTEIDEIADEFIVL